MARAVYLLSAPFLCATKNAVLYVALSVRMVLCQEGSACPLSGLISDRPPVVMVLM